MPVCDECGSHQVGPEEIDGLQVEVCGLCGHVQGDPDLAAQVEERQEAEDLGYNPLIYPFVKALERVPTFHVTAASAGRPDTCEFPYVFLRVAPDGLRDIERLLTSLEMANRHTKRRWVVECTLQRGLLFYVRPRFWKSVQEITPQDIRECRGDLNALAEAINRDVQLSWWTDG